MVLAAPLAPSKRREMPWRLFARLRPIVEPRTADALAAGAQIVRGVAWSPHGVGRVDISIDGGAHWQPATLLEDLGPRAWRQFQWRWDAAPGDYLLAARAADLAGNVQPIEVPFKKAI